MWACRRDQWTAVAEAALPRRPDLGVLFIMGFAEIALTSPLSLAPSMHVLIKPFTIDVVSERISGLLRREVSWLGRRWAGKLRQPETRSGLKRTPWALEEPPFLRC
jgi:hypothetical protein